MILNQSEMIPKERLPNCSGGPAVCPFEEEVLQLRQRVISDPLTELYNAGYFRDALAQEIERTERSFISTALLMIDLDHFKRVNDVYGHEAGNQVLKQVARLIVHNTRKLDIQCRYGGEEFAVILPSIEPRMAIAVAERLHQAIASTVVMIEGTKLDITASMGLAMYQAGSMVKMEAFIKEADSYLYRAKNSGRNQLLYNITLQESDASVSAEEKEALNKLFVSND